MRWLMLLMLTACSTPCQREVFTGFGSGDPELRAYVNCTMEMPL